MFVVYLYSAAENSRFVQQFSSTVIYSVLCAIGIRLLWIQAFRSQSVDDPVCCGEDHPDSECPFVFRLEFILVLIALVTGRLILSLYCYRRCFKRPPKQLQLQDGYLQVSTVDPDSPPPVAERRRAGRLPRRMDAFF